MGARIAPPGHKHRSPELGAHPLTDAETAQDVGGRGKMANPVRTEQDSGGKNEAVQLCDYFHYRHTIPTFQFILFTTRNGQLS